MPQPAFTGTHAVIIRGNDLEALAAFYQAVGFPLLRRTANVVQLTVGDGSLLEIGRVGPGVPPNPEIESRVQTRMCAVFHTADLPGALARAIEHGGQKLDTLPLPTAMLTYIADPEGNVVGLRQAAPEPEETSMPEEALFLGPGSLVVRAHDRDRLERFYTEIGFPVRRTGDEWMSFELGGGAWLDLGRITPGTPRKEPITDRNAIGVFSLVRVRDLDEAVANIERAGGRIITVHRVQSSAVAVVADPEENVWGMGWLAPQDRGESQPAG